MAWANPANVTTVNLDSSSDDPSLARAEIYAALLELQAVIGGRNTASGVAPLDASSLVPAANLPNTLVSSAGNNLLLQPTTGIVGINYLLNLTDKTVSNLEALTPVPNMIAMCSNGDGGGYCLAVYTGDNDAGTGYPIWYRVPLDNRVSATLKQVYNLPAQTVSELTALTATAGDVAYCSNGDAGSACLAVYNGSAWKRVALGATISAT